MDAQYNIAKTLLEPLKTPSIAVLLVDDQHIIAEVIRRMLQDEKDIIFHYCQDPMQAVKIALQMHPTVILQDLVMPGIDGLALMSQFRSHPVTCDIPMIVLSSKEDPEVKAEAFSMGTNDYLVKLPDKIELIARIRYHSKAYIRLLERNQAYEKLAESQKVLSLELAEAAKYVKSLLPPPLIEGGVEVNWTFIPSMQLGGDAFSYHWLDDSHFAFYLLDVCGHGIGAALLSISIINFLRLQTKGQSNLCDPAQVLSTLNEMFPMEKHQGMFFTMWYGVYNKMTRELSYASGGHPPAILLEETEDSAFTQRLSCLYTPGLVVGGMPNAHYASSHCSLSTNSKLYLFSDGVFEITKSDNSMFSFEEFISLLKKNSSHQQDLEQILNYSKAINKQEFFADDYSLLRFVFK